MIRRAALVLALLGVASLARPSSAAIFTWNDTNGNWAADSNWQEGTAPTNGTDTTLYFGGSTNESYTANNDIGGTFVLNQVILTNSVSGLTHTNIGNQIQFAGTTPQLLQNAAGRFQFENDVDLTSTTTLSGSGSGRVILAGDISGDGGLYKSGTWTLELTGSNTYAGTTLLTNSTLLVNNTSGSGTSTGRVTVAKGTLSGTGTVGGSVILNDNGILTGSGTVVGQVTINPGGTVAGSPTILSNVAVNSQGTLSGSGTVQGNVSVNFGGLVRDAVTIAGNATINNTAKMTGSGTVSGNVTVNNGGTLTGTPTIGGLVVNKGGVIAPGSSPGTMNTGNTVWDDGGIYVWEIDSFLGTAGGDPGWDLLNISGTLNITAPSFDPFIIRITSLSHPLHTAGLATGFNNLQDYSLVLATASGGITGYSPSAFILDTSAFLNPFQGFGVWSINQSGNDLVLNYTAVPEPSTVVLWLLGLGVFGVRYWRGRPGPVASQS